MARILVAEDDVGISDMLCELLGQNGHLPVAAYSGTEALLRLEKEQFSLVLLDLMLPGKTGCEVLRELRLKSGVPVIVLTAVSDKATVVELLGAGADDYISKPFDNQELLARIKARLRTTATSCYDSQKLLFKDIVLHKDRFDAFIGGEAAGLSKTEFAILELLMSFPTKVFTKNNLYETIWGDRYLGDDNTINVHISKLRSKLASLNPQETYIVTVWGIGFKMG